MENTDSDSEADPELILTSLQSRADRLLIELKTFQHALREHGKQDEVELRVFIRGIESEAKSLRTIAKRCFASPSCRESNARECETMTKNNVHALRSSNLPFYEALWETTRASSRVTALGRKIHWNTSSIHDVQRSRNGRGMNTTSASSSNKHSAVVDIIADDGLKWIKISTITNKRLLYEMAKEGWESYADFSSDDADSNPDEHNVDHSEGRAPRLELVKLASTLYAASRTQRVCFKHPSVHFVLPNIEEFVYPDVDAVLEEMRKIGIVVQCPPTSARSISSDLQHSPSLDDSILRRLLPSSPKPVLTSEVNIDCTVLLALISDISHCSEDDLPQSPRNRSGTYHEAILRQIKNETQFPLLPNELYPVICRRTLVSTSKAAHRMYQIALTMGTESEKQRADIFFARDRFAELSSSQLRTELGKLSRYPVPANLQLPVRMVDYTDRSTLLGHSSTASCTHDAQAYADGIANGQTQRTQQDQEQTHYQTSSDNAFTISNLDVQIATQLRTSLRLSPINTAVFLYGWMKDIVTITSNKVVAININKTINELLDKHERESEPRASTEGSGFGSLGNDWAHSVETEDIRSDVDNSNSQGGLKITDLSREMQGVTLDATEEQFIGPKIYVCETARSLVGKDKQVAVADIHDI